MQTRMKIRVLVGGAHPGDRFAGTHEGQSEGSREGVEERLILRQAAHERPALQVHHKHTDLQYHSSITGYANIVSIYTERATRHERKH